MRKKQIHRSWRLRSEVAVRSIQGYFGRLPLLREDRGRAGQGERPQKRRGKGLHEANGPEEAETLPRTKEGTETWMTGNDDDVAPVQAVSREEHLTHQRH